MKRWAVLAVTALVLMNLNMVSAGYITMWTIPGRQFNPGDSITWDLPDWQGKLKISISWSGHAGIYGYSSWDMYIYTDSAYVKIHQSVNDALYVGTTKIADAYANTVVINTQNNTVEFYYGASLVATATVAGTYIDKIILSCPTSDDNGDTATEFTLNSIKVYKYSQLLNSLTVLDENTGENIVPFDFSENNDSVRVESPNYVARTYIVSPGANLTAYLVSYSDGHWYSIQTDPNSTIEALRNYDGVKVAVAVTRADTNGDASMYLSDGILYTFRVTTPGGDVSEFTKVTNPSSPTIILGGSSISSTAYIASPFNSISYSFEPSDRILYTGENNTITAKVLSESGNINGITMNFYKNGILVSNASLAGSPTGGVLTLDVGGNFTTTDRLWATLLITTTTNETLKIDQAFIVKEPLNATNSLFGIASDVPAKLGIGQLGVTIILSFLALVLAAAVGAGERGSIIIVILLYVAGAILGWVHWIIAMFAGIAGIGVLTRRGEA